MLSPSKTSLTMSEDCEEMQRCEKTEESLALERKAKSALIAELRKKMLCEQVERWKEMRRERERERERERQLKFCLEMICSSSEGPLVEQSCQLVVNENGHKFNMTEVEYNLWKHMPEKLKDVLIQIIPAKAEVVRRLRSEARKGKAKAKAALRASQELKTGGGSSTVNYAPESSDIEAGTSSTQADDEHVVHTNPETGGSSSTAQNEPPPSHRGLPVGGDHQVRNVQVNGPMNQTVNYAPESFDIEAGPSSTQDVGDKSFTLFPSETYSDEVCKEVLCSENGKPWLGGYSPRNSWYGNELDLAKLFIWEPIFLSSEDPLVEQSCQAVVNENGHKFNMTEGEYISSWKYGSKKLKDVLIQSVPKKAEEVGRLRSEARKGKAKAASPASQELKIGGGSSTVNYAPESSDIEARTPSTQANDEHAEHTNPETGGGSSTAQNEPPPNHRGLPVVGDHQVRNVQVNGPMNQTVNYAPESSDIEAGTSSTQADDDPAEHTNLETGGGSSTAQNEPHTNPEIGGGSPTAQNDSNTNPETGGGSPTEQNERRPNHQGLPVGGEPARRRCRIETIITVIGEVVSIFLAVKSDKNSAGGMTTKEKYFWDFLVLCIIVGIISFCYGLCLSDGGGRGRGSMVARVARVANAVSYVATGFAVVTAAGLQFHNQKMVWLIPLFWALIVPAIVGYAWKQR